jgi:hypothetical protein
MNLEIPNEDREVNTDRIVPLTSREIHSTKRLEAMARLVTEAFAHPLRTSFVGVNLDSNTVVVRRTSSRRLRDVVFKVVETLRTGGFNLVTEKKEQK